MSSASPVPGDGCETDSVLIQAVRSGDMDAASTLYVRHYAAALRAARGIGKRRSATATPSASMACQRSENTLTEVTFENKSD